MARTRLSRAPERGPQENNFRIICVLGPWPLPQGLARPLPALVHKFVSGNEGDHFEKLFGGDPANFAVLVSTLRGRVEALDQSWRMTRPPIEGIVREMEIGVPLEMTLNPSQLTWKPELSLKHKSKDHVILKHAKDFLEEICDTIQHPLQTFFPQGARVGDEIQTGGVGIRNGMARNMAVKVNLLSIVSAGITDEELMEILPQVKAMLCLKVVFLSLGGAKADRHNALRDKFGAASAVRPDVVQISYMLLQDAAEQGKSWEECEHDIVRTYQGGSSNEKKQLSDLEATIVALYPKLGEDTQKLLCNHWQLYKVPTSGVNYADLASVPMNAGLKPKSQMQTPNWQEWGWGNLIRLHMA